MKPLIFMIQKIDSLSELVILAKEVKPHEVHYLFPLNP